MFTGIVEKHVRVLDVTQSGPVRRITLESDWPDLRPGESVAVNGCCLTIADLAPGRIGFDVIKETLDRTNLGLLKVEDRVNVERALRVGDRLDGHFVQGHVDGVARLAHTVSNDKEFRLGLEPPAELRKYIVHKGSVCIDGVSLTVASVSWPTFEVALIPTTLNLTTLGQRSIGWPFNLETDIVSKHIVAWLEARGT